MYAVAPGQSSSVTLRRCGSCDFDGIVLVTTNNDPSLFNSDDHYGDFTWDWNQAVGMIMVFSNQGKLGGGDIINEPSITTLQTLYT